MIENKSNALVEQDSEKSNNPAVGVETDVRHQSLFTKQMFKYTVRLPKHNLYALATIEDYPKYPPYQFETEVIYVIADDFESANALIKEHPRFKCDVTIRHIDSVERIHDKVFIQTNGSVVR